ncbi:MAG: hypothetical protein NVS9B7_29320 [Flavisolibacter sp.]
MKTAKEIIEGHYICTCDKIYLSRGLPDPTCLLCSEIGEIEMMMEEHEDDVRKDEKARCLKTLENIFSILNNKQAEQVVKNALEMLK